ncbi:MAG: cell surface protein [Dysgonomonas sp.]|nr:cell surface protein [Dysgonomonas sp.]
MRKLLYLLPLISIIFVACSSDDDIITEKNGELEVLEYRPAAGQFINKNMDCKTMEEANAWAEERFKDGSYVSLGSFGGYIIVKMPKEIKNRKGYDFGIEGNPFEGSSEPGIVWVMEDTNNNGLADDIWYELKGSDITEKGYEVTYYRPSEPGDVKWTDNKGNEGVIKYLPQYHTQIYYPTWIKEDSYTLKGSMLQPRVVNDGGVWKNQSFEWGFADNMGSDAAKNSSGNYRYNQFELDNAIDSNGNSVSLTQIHFVKVQNAILKNVESIGEVSTEIVGFKVF